MDAQEPPPAAADMPGEVKGQRLFRLFGTPARAGRKDLDAPDLMVHYSGTAAQRCAAFFGPPLPAFVPAHRFSTDGIGAPCPQQAAWFAVRSALDIHGLAEHTHGASPAG